MAPALPASPYQHPVSDAEAALDSVELLGTSDPAHLLRIVSVSLLGDMPRSSSQAHCMTASLVSALRRRQCLRRSCPPRPCLRFQFCQQRCRPQCHKYFHHRRVPWHLGRLRRCFPRCSHPRKRPCLLRHLPCALAFGGFACCTECNTLFVAPAAGLCDGCAARKSAVVPELAVHSRSGSKLACAPYGRACADPVKTKPDIRRHVDAHDWYGDLLPTIGVARSVREHRQSEQLLPTETPTKSRGPRCTTVLAVPNNNGPAPPYGRRFLCKCHCRCKRAT